MRGLSAAAAALAALALACGRKTGDQAPAPTVEPPATAHAPRTFRVAAVQFHSVMGEPSRNRERLVPMVERAAAGGAKIVVLPEAAVPGYADLSTDTFWSKDDVREKGYLPVHAFAEAVPGPSTEFFSPLADRLDIYLTVPIIEKAEGKYYNTVVLLAPDGGTSAHHRKYNLWTVADSSWASSGPKRATVVDTEHGRIGLMICYDMHALLGEFGRAKADIVLHSVAFYGPNTRSWFETTLAFKVADAR
ncbi:MAG: carbon-nitrogen hydrolase family protein, partial [Planctomycetota bacterium]